MIGHEIHDLAKRLWPICRSLTGNGVRETLGILKELIPDLRIHEVPSGTPCFDWTVPHEWNLKDAYVLDPDGNKIIDFKSNNLHVLGYSTPVDRELDLQELNEHLYSLPDQPDAIPYVTSYYKERWGFCLTQKQRDALKPGKYRIKIDSTLQPGHMTYGELLIPGQTEKEILLSTYVCHPSIANNELSGPCVTTFLARHILQNENRKFSYRIVFVPETIGSILYISKHLDELRKKVIAGYVLTCIGDERSYSFLSSRNGETLADRVGRHVLRQIDSNFKSYSFLTRGSDERQYCSPGVDLPVASIMRTKYNEYPEYHTSLDDLNLVTPKGLEGGFTAVQRALQVIEQDRFPRSTTLCEPQLGKRGLYPTVSIKGGAEDTRTMLNVIAYSDGKNSILDIAELLQKPFWEIEEIVARLESHDVLRSISQ